MRWIGLAGKLCAREGDAARTHTAAPANSRRVSSKLPPRRPAGEPEPGADAGAPYVAACRRIIEQLDEAERAAAGEYQAPRGELTVTAPMVFGRVHVVPVVAGFMEAYPEVSLNMRLSDRVLDMQEEHVDV